MTDKIFDKALQKQIADADQQQSINRNTRPATSELIVAFAKAVLTTIREHLLRDGFVRIHHFGTFRLKVSKARKVYNPQTRQSILQEPKARVVFTPAKALKEKIEPHPLPVQALQREQTKPAPPSTFKPISAPTAIGAQISLSTENTTNTKLASDGIDHETLSRSAIASSLLKSKSPEPDALATLTMYLPEKPRRANKSQSETETLRQLRQISHTREPSGLQPEPIETEYRYDDDWEVKSLSKPQTTNDSLPLPRVSVPQATQHSKSSFHYTRNLGITSLVVILLLAALIFWMYPGSEKEFHVNSTSQVSATPEPIVIPSIPKPFNEYTGNNEISTTTSDSSTTLAIPAEETTEIKPIAEYAPVTTHSVPASDAPFFQKTQYQIRNGDNLWGLSRKNYLNPFLWPHIYRANYAHLPNPDLLEVRNTITLPTLQGSPEELALIDHHNIAEGYFLLYQYYKKIGHNNPHHALIGVKWFAPDVLMMHQSEIDPLDISKLNAKRKDNVLIQSALSRSAP